VARIGVGWQAIGGGYFREGLPGVREGFFQLVGVGDEWKPRMNRDKHGLERWVAARWALFFGGRPGTQGVALGCRVWPLRGDDVVAGAMRALRGNEGVAWR
jgi:hypothetical protein